MYTLAILPLLRAAGGMMWKWSSKTLFFGNLPLTAIQQLCHHLFDSNPRLKIRLVSSAYTLALRGGVSSVMVELQHVRLVNSDNHIGSFPRAPPIVSYLNPLSSPMPTTKTSRVVLPRPPLRLVTQRKPFSQSSPSFSHFLQNHFLVCLVVN